MALLYTFDGWPSSPSVNNTIRTYNLDTNTWVTSGVTAAPFVGKVNSSSSFRQKGGWDPVASKWYVISPTGTIYAWDQSGNTWSGPLASGAIIVYNTAEDHHWDMASDGRFVYILKSDQSNTGQELFRYDPAADTLDMLGGPPAPAGLTVTSQGKQWMVFDESDHLYCYDSNDTARVAEFTISKGSWRFLPAPTGVVSNAGNYGFGFWAGGKLLLIYAVSNTFGDVFSYDQNTNTWTQKSSTAFTFNVNTLSLYNLDSSTKIRIWNANGTNESYTYDYVNDVWANGSTNVPFTAAQGTNWAQTRVYGSKFVWYEADGVTPLGNLGHRSSVGSGTVDFTFSYHVVVKSVDSIANSVTVSVPNMPEGDGDDVVTISNTQGGSYSSSFTLSSSFPANTLIDVWIKVMPTINQSLGMQKPFNLLVVKT